MLAPRDRVGRPQVESLPPRLRNRRRQHLAGQLMRKPPGDIAPSRGAGQNPCLLRLAQGLCAVYGLGAVLFFAARQRYSRGGWGLDVWLDPVFLVLFGAVALAGFVLWTAISYALFGQPRRALQPAVALALTASCTASIAAPTASGRK